MNAVSATPMPLLHGCIDDIKKHQLRNRTGNVSARNAFLSRAGLMCYGRCVRGVVDGCLVGSAVPNAQLEIRDPETGQPVAPGSVGAW